MSELSLSEVYETPIRAYVHREVGAPGQVESINLRKVESDDVRVRIDAVGVCHSDLSLANGTLDQKMPVVLGHEASGTIVEIGDKVANVNVGDTVVLLWNPSCGHCWYCRQGDHHLCEHATDNQRRPLALDSNNETVWAGLGVGGFAEETVVPQSCVMPVTGVSPEQAAMIGCASTTGVGAVVNTARVQAGQSVAVVGLGGVGLSAVQGALLSGASPVIAIDRSTDRLQQAIELGAIGLEAGDDITKRVRKATNGRGADIAVDCVGAAATIRQSWGMTRRGGTAVVVGIGPKTAEVTFNPLELFYFARTLVGCVAGGGDPRSDYPRLLEWARTGELVTDGLITDRRDLGGIDDAFVAMSSASGGRTVIHPKGERR